MDEEPTPVAGWYADPHDGSYLRWWDGEAWTGHTQAYPLEAAGTAEGGDRSDAEAAAAFGAEDGAESLPEAAGHPDDGGPLSGELLDDTAAASAAGAAAGRQDFPGFGPTPTPMSENASTQEVSPDSAWEVAEPGSTTAPGTDASAAVAEQVGFPSSADGQGSDTPTHESTETASASASGTFAPEEAEVPGLAEPVEPDPATAAGQTAPGSGDGGRSPEFGQPQPVQDQSQFGAPPQPEQPGQPQDQSHYGVPPQFGQPQPAQDQPQFGQPQPAQDQPQFGQPQPAQDQPQFGAPPQFGQPAQDQPQFGVPPQSEQPQPDQSQFGQPAAPQAAPGFPATPQGAFGASPQGQGGYLGTPASPGYGDPNAGAPQTPMAPSGEQQPPPGAYPGAPAGYGQPAAYVVPGQAPAGSTGYSPVGPGAAAFGVGAAAGAASGFGDQGHPVAGQGDQSGFGQPPGGYGEQAAGFGDQSGFGQPPGAYGYQDPYGQDPYAQDPYAQDPYGQYPQTEDIDVDGEEPKRSRLPLIILLAVLGVVVLAGLIWYFFLRDSGGTEVNPTASPNPTATGTTGGTSAACESLAATLTDQDQTTEISVKLQELAKNVNASQNAQYFSDLQKTVEPTKKEFSQQCLADVNAGKAPKTYQTYLQSFDRAVSSGATIGKQIVAAKKVTPDQNSTLLDDAARLEQATDALPAAAKGDTGTSLPSDIPTDIPTDLPSAIPTGLNTGAALPSRGAA